MSIKKNAKEKALLLVKIQAIREDLENMSDALSILDRNLVYTVQRITDLLMAIQDQTLLDD